jgi:hypothetical protein
MSFTNLEKKNFIGGIRRLADKMNEAAPLSNERFDFCLGLYEMIIANYDLAIAIVVNAGRNFSNSIARAEAYLADIETLIEQGRTDKIVIDCRRVLEEYIRISSERAQLQPVDLQGRFNIVANVNDIDE